MRISQINISAPLKYTYIQSKNNQAPIVQTVHNNEKKYSAENVKANFIPNFNGYKKVGYTTLKHRVTGIPVRAELRKNTIKKDNIGSFSFFSLILDREEIGYMVLDCDSVYPVAEHVMTFPTDNIPKVAHLRSIGGDKYSGIGTALIKAAIQESYNNGNYGNLWLTSEKGYAKSFSKYRSDENPIPFYYKVGFKAPNKKTDNLITNCLKNNKYEDLPKFADLLLTQEAKNKWLKELVKNPIMKFKRTPIDI